MNKKDKKSFKTIFNEVKYPILCFFIGGLLGVGIMEALKPEQIATLSDDSTSIAVWGEKDKDGKYTEGLSANELYSKLKDNAQISVALDLIDAELLNKDYEYDKYLEEAKSTADEYISNYGTYYNLNEKDFLSYYGFATKNDFIKSIALDSQRYDYYADVVKSSLKESDLKSFYKKNVYGPISINYIAVDKDDESKVDEALIKEIQKKVNKGTSFEDIAEAYKEKEGFSTNSLTLSYEQANDKVIESAARKLKDGEHSKNYVISDDLGYIIIFKVSSEDKPTYDSVKSELPDVILNKKTVEDEKLYYNVLIDMRDKNGVKFTDEKFIKLYKEYKKSVK